VPGLKPILGAPPPATAAAQAQITAGETILRVNDQAVSTWQDVRWVLLERAVDRQVVTLEVQNEKGEIAFRKLDLSGLDAGDLDSDFLAKIGLTRLPPPPVVGDVTAGKPGDRAGLKPGDRIVAVDGKPVATWDDLVAAVSPKGGASLTLQLRRGADELSVQVTPETVQQNGESIGRIWVAPDRAALERQIVEVSYGPFAALSQAAVRTWEVSILSLRMLGKMIVGDVSLKNLSGPITIADYAGQSAQMGWVAYVSFIALISISLGVLNLLPVPLLDGGHLMYYFVEIIKGRPVSERALEIGQRVGMVVLFTLMAFALFNDIHRLVGG
jgi:regulator of sigma E protease